MSNVEGRLCQAFDKASKVAKGGKDLVQGNALLIAIKGRVELLSMFD